MSIQIDESRRPLTSRRAIASRPFFGSVLLGKLFGRRVNNKICPTFVLLKSRQRKTCFMTNEKMSYVEQLRG